MCLSMPAIFWSPKVLWVVGSKIIILLHHLNAFLIGLKCRTTCSLPPNHIPMRNLLDGSIEFKDSSHLSVVIIVSSSQIPRWNLHSDFNFIVSCNYLCELLGGKKDSYWGVFTCLSAPSNNQVNSLSGLLSVLLYFLVIC